MSEKLPLFTKVFCGDKSPLGYIADILAVGAKDCWCCSFWRGMLFGMLTGITLTTVFVVVL